MFSSIGAKLTLWNICVLALILSVFAVVTYVLFLRVVQDESKTNLTEMAGNFVTSVTQLQNEKTRGLDPNILISEALEEFQFRDYKFAVFDRSNVLVGTTIDTEIPPELISAGQGQFSKVQL